MVQLAFPLTEAHTQFCKKPRRKLGARELQFTTLCCSATNAPEEVHERGAKAAVCLNRYGHEGVPGIFPAPYLGGVAVGCHRARALCIRPLRGGTTRMDD